MKKLAALIFLLVCPKLFAQVTPTQIRTTTALPATCQAGTGTTPMDMVGLVSGGVTQLYVCTQTNTWANLSASAQLNPPTDQTFQAPNATTATHFKCPTGADANFAAYDFQAPDGSNIMAFRCGKTVVFADGISGFWLAQYFGSSTGVISQTALLRAANTDCAVGWRNNAGTGDVTICKDNTDTINIALAAHIKVNTLYIPQMTAMTAGQGMVANGTDTGYSSAGKIYADNPTFAVGAGGDFCKILNNAATAANTLKVDVDARGLGAGTDQWCDSLPIPDSYSGSIILPAANIHIRSVAGIFLLHSRVHLLGDREGRTASGPTSGTIISACANDNAVCNGATFNPTAGGVCKDGGGVTTIPCALISWSLSANPGVPITQMFASTVENMTINCDGIASCIGIQGGMFPISGSCTGKCGPQENSFIKNVRIEDWGNAGIGIKLMAGTSNFQMDGLNLLNENLTIADCSTSTAIDVLFDSSVSANGPKQISDVTNTNSHCTIKPLQTMKLDAGQVRVQGIHAEDVTDYNIDLGARSNFIGVTVLNANGVVSGANNAVIHVASGHTGGLSAISTYNNNVAGYTILDDYHGTGIRVDCQSLTAIYAFGDGIFDPVVTDAPCVPHANPNSAPFITNVALAAGDIVKVVPASTTYQITTNTNTTETKQPLGIALATITDTSVRVPVALNGSIVGVAGIPGPILDTAMPDCHMGDFVWYGPTTNGRAQCSTARPANTGTAGIALNTATAGNQIPMLVRTEGTFQPQLTECTGTGTSANPSVISCGVKSVGELKCAHAATGGTCEVDFTAGFIKATSVIMLTGDTSVTTGCDPLTAALYISARSFAPASACSTNTLDCFTFPVQALGGTNGLCFQYSIQNITP